MRYFKQIPAFICLFVSLMTYSQAREQHSKILDSLIKTGELDKARQALDQSIHELSYTKDYFSLADLVFYVGKLSEEKSNRATGKRAVTVFMEQLHRATDSAKVLRQLYLTASSFYKSAGYYQDGYNANLKALAYTKKWTGARGEDFGVVENNLSNFSDYLGHVKQSQKHAKNALNYFESDPSTSSKNLYNSYNTMAVSMWKVSKIDSALYYFKKYENLLETLEKTPETILGEAYLRNNLSSIYGTQGNVELGLASLKRTIACLQIYLKADISEKRRDQAKAFLYSAVENYGLMTKKNGDYQKALDIYLSNFKIGKKTLGPDHALLFETKIKLGQIYLDLNDFEKANLCLDDAITQIAATPGENYLYNADAHFVKAMVSMATKNKSEAKTYFEKAEQLYKLGLEGSYDDVYLKLIENAAHYYAQNNETERALKMSQKAYDYVKKNQGITSVFEIQQTLNLGKIYYELHDYPKALEKSQKTLELLKGTLPTLEKLTDSTIIYQYYPATVLLQTQIKYASQPDKKQEFLKDLLNDLNKSITIVEHQKSHLGEALNITMLIEENEPVFDFAKKISLELYELTGNKKYLNKLISLNESLLYNKIRSQLISRESMAYRDVPADILEKEKTIKVSLLRF